MGDPAIPKVSTGSAEGLSARAGTLEKRLRKFPRNPLISLDSDERIQGNPRESNRQNRGFSQQNGANQEKPNRSRLLTKLAGRGARFERAAEGWPLAA